MVFFTAVFRIIWQLGSELSGFHNIVRSTLRAYPHFMNSFHWFLEFSLFSTKYLGNSLYIERFYTFLMIVLIYFLISKLWRTVFEGKPNYSKLDWLPTLLWIGIPVCFWSYRSNMLENTVSVFALCSILISYKQILSNKEKLILWIISGFFVFLSSFSKGLPGLFLIGFPNIIFFNYKKNKF